MKRLKKLIRSKKQQDTEHSARITNETVAEHRERILAGGRRFKYPVQYARHRLVINTIVISIIALILLIALVGWQLYSQQNSSDFFYRITRAIPLPVASVDGRFVPYSDYLVGYRSQAYYLEFKEGINLKSVENKAQVDYIKRKAMNDAVKDAYAAKLAPQYNVKVNETDVDRAIQRQRVFRDGTASKETYDAIILDHFNWTPDEARGVTSRKLLHQEVAYAIDTKASQKRDLLIQKLKTETDFDKIAAELDGGSAKVVSAVRVLVPSNNQDGGLATQAASLKKGETSSVFKSTSGDGYYIVRLLDSDNNDHISYAYIQIPLTAFEEQFAKIKSEGKIQEYIKVPALQAQSDQ